MKTLQPMKLRALQRVTRSLRHGAPAALTLLCALGIDACALGPNYQRPAMPMPAHWNAPLPSQAAASEPAVPPGRSPAAPIARPAQWWSQFNDPELAHLVDEALNDNLNIQAAGERIAQARAERDVAAGAELPAVNGVGQYSRYKLPSAIQTELDQGINQAGSATGTTTPGSINIPRLPRYLNVYELGFDTKWELDIFGATRRSVEAAEAQRQAAQAAQQGALIAALAELGNDYAQLRATQAREAIALRVQATDRMMLDLTQSRRSNGLASDLDVDQARTALESANAQVPPLHAQVLASIHALAVLVAQLPESLEAELSVAAPVPLALPALPVGLPTALLNHRPDIVEAERTLVAANARVGVAVAQRFPTVSLSAGADLFSTQLNQLVKNQALSWSLGVDLAAPIFEGGRLAANERGAKAAARESALQYRQTVLQALAETEDALQRYAAERTQYGSLQAAEVAAEEAWRDSVDLYRQGLASYLQVLDAQRSLDSLRDQLAQSEGDQAQAYIAIYKALGGGW